MEGSSAQQSPGDNADPSPSSEKRVLRRRFVQSTLFPQKQADKSGNSSAGKGEVSKDCGIVEADDRATGDDECCGSQRKRKGKQTPKTKAHGSGAGDEECCGSQEKRKRKQTPKTKAHDSGADDEECCGSQGKRKRKQTPKTKVTPGSAKKAARNGKTALAGLKVDGQSPVKGSPQNLTDHVLRPISLRLEAKMTAEEDSRRLAGKQLHPFFSSLKVRKKEVLDNGETSAPRRNTKKFDCGPIHVFENVEDVCSSINWSNWSFSDGIFNNASCTGSGLSSSHEVSVRCLTLDNMADATRLLREPTCKDGSLLHEDNGNQRMTDSSLLFHDLANSCQLLKDIGEDHSMVQLSIGSECDRCLKADLELDNSKALESSNLHRVNKKNQPDNSLWTTKYQPEKASEVCGNAESVEVLTEWLGRWREMDLRNSKKPCNAAKDDDDCDSYDSEYDEDPTEKVGLDNVLLVAGPVGSGKTAAIYACAKEHGFEVVEVNSSDWRSGAVMKQKFWEAVGLHWLKRNQESPISSSKLKMKSRFNLSTDGDISSNKEDTEVIPVSDNEAADVAVDLSQNSVCSEISDQGEIKTLILFEDVDVNLNEDRGLMYTIQQLAHMAKRPMILTTNSCGPSLPDNLDREEVFFIQPLQNELLSHVTMVCNSEEVDPNICLIDKYIKYCKGDIRKTLMNLQFWCQGKEDSIGNMVHKKYSPLMFNAEAGHRILPKIISWGFPSELSEYIEREISSSLCRVEENLVLFPWSEEAMEDISIPDELAIWREETSIEAKKKLILSRNFPNNGDELIAAVVNPLDVTNCSESPIAFTRRNSSKKSGIVMSDSDDEISNDETLGIMSNPCNDIMVYGVESQFPIIYPIADSMLNPSSLGDTDFWHQFSGAENIANINEMCLSASAYNISRVPESTFVPETELNSRMELSTMADTEVTSRANVENVDEPVPKLPEVFREHESTNDMNINSLDDEMADSQNEIRVRETRAKRFLPFDECSRFDFHKGSNRLVKCCSQPPKDHVQESWKDLKQRDLRQQLTKEHSDVSQALNLASKFCNLLSESDLLLHGCNILTTESTSQVANLNDDNFTFGSHNEQVEMAASISEHGYCVLAKDVISLGLRIGLDDNVNVVEEMIASTSNSMALGKLLRYDKATGKMPFSISGSSSTPDVTDVLLSERESKTNLEDIIYSLVPPRCHLSLRGNSLPEYLSSLALMNQSESARISQNQDKMKRRRGRISKNYLTSGALSLTPEDMTALSRYKYNHYVKFSSQQSSQTTQDPK